MRLLNGLILIRNVVAYGRLDGRVRARAWVEQEQPEETDDH